MIIIKTLGQDTFSWNPNAFNRRGHWFLLAETGSYIRVATKAEMSKLGTPKKQDEAQVDVKTGERKMSYQRAAEIRKKSLKNLITDKLVEGEGIGSSIGGSISEKMKARTTGLKEKFDPLNIAKMFTGKLGSALLGKITGRSKEDIRYFSGDKKQKETTSRTSYANEKLNKSDTGLYSAISEGNTQSMKKGDGIATVLARMYNLIKSQQIESLKRFQIEKNFKKIKEKQKDKWNKELIQALGGKKSFTIVKETKKEESGSLLDIISGIIAGIKAWVLGKLENFKTAAKAVLPVIGAAASALGVGKTLLDKITKPSSTTAPIDQKNKEVKPEEKKEVKPEEKKPGDKKLNKEITKELEKTGDSDNKKPKATKVGKTEEVPKASKVSTVLKGAKGVVKYLTKLPMIGVIAGAYEMIGTIQQAIDDHEAGKITDGELKKTVISTTASIITAGAGTSIGATIGATVGSVAGPIGTFVGGAAGGIAGYIGGKYAGKAGAEKLFDYVSKSNSEVEPKIDAVRTEEQMVKSTDQPKSEGIKKSKVPAAIDGATQSTSTPASMPTATASATEPQTAVPVSTPSMTDARLQSTMDKNNEMKAVGKSSINSTIIDNSQSINAAAGGDGGIMVDSSVSPRIDDSTLQRVHRQNLRPI
jgi:hypothetical protein